MEDARLAKFNKLNEIFEIAEETVHEIIIEENKLDNLPTIYVEENEEEDLVSYGTLKADLKIIRETLMGSVMKGKLIIDQITIDIVENGMVDAKLVDAVANLIKSTNSSLKELSSIFKDMQELDDKKKKKAPEQTGPVSNTQNNIFVGNASQLMELLNNKGN